ncbi:MAG: sulfotransferase family protein, partial [Rhodanobacteraceae bacterium]
GAHRGRRWYHRAGLAQSWGRRRLRELESTYWPEKRRWPVPLRWNACAERYVALLDHAAGTQGKSHWIEKTPNHLLFIDEMTRHVPGARFVHVLRNGTDVVASIIDADLHHSTSVFRGGVALWAARWNHAMDLHLARARQSSHHLVCLEDLVGDPAVEWTRLCEFLQLDADAPLLVRPGSAVADSRQEPWKRGATAGVIQAPTSKAKGLFGPRTLAWLASNLADYHAIQAAVARSHGVDHPGAGHHGVLSARSHGGLVRH